ncbi:MAG: hypothetical protein INF92_19375 [Rhodobacter sp.]|nr:hypothetical protein [Rhodobacter sp.]
MAKFYSARSKTIPPLLWQTFALPFSGHVGTLNHYRAKLREITDSAFKEGEHAE